jgi:formate dehydrogenase (coenzyme F420) beta subunit
VIPGKDEQMIDAELKGACLPGAAEPGVAVLDFLRLAMTRELADAVILPVKVPSGDSFAWILMNDISLIDDAVPIAATMPVQGAKALRNLTRKGAGNLTVIAVMRPCEIRAAVELVKLGQVHPDNLILVSYDCPGAVQLQKYVADPSGSEERFAGMLLKGKPDNSAKPVCHTCEDFSMFYSDVHFGYLGLSKKEVHVIPGTDKGSKLLEGLGLNPSRDLSEWNKGIDELKAERIKARRSAFEETGKQLRGFSGLLSVFSNCIGCRNCQSACPICYCRLCYFDSETAEQDPDALISSASKRGGISLPEDRFMFHVGRMTHMSLSCVSCGQCSDACPVSIPVAGAFSYVADRTQSTFEYKAGRNEGDPLPLRQFRKSELPGVHELVKTAEAEASSHE